MPEATLGLGGNIGDPPAAMAAALQALDRAGARVRAVSRLYKTPPWGVTDQPWFYNACALVETSRDAGALLELCLSVERGLKRERRERWGPRSIDIDLLTYDGERIAAEGLTVPHPEMTRRAFVLVPLAEIAPDLVVNGRTVADLRTSIDDAGIKAASPDGTWWTGGGEGGRAV